MYGAGQFYSKAMELLEKEPSFKILFYIMNKHLYSSK